MFSFTSNFIPISNTCFPEKTKITTDQGIIFIENIDPKINTIQNKKIVAITKTITLDNYLICFEKNCFGLNCPSENTIMSKFHKIYFHGRMIEARIFIRYFTNIKAVPYNRKILYNILMEKYDVLYINNLICETLHPNNIIAQLYLNKKKRSITI